VTEGATGLDEDVAGVGVGVKDADLEELDHEAFEESTCGFAELVRIGWRIGGE
jgi:hypothetical protein